MSVFYLEMVFNTVLIENSSQERLRTKCVTKVNSHFLPQCKMFLHLSLSPAHQSLNCIVYKSFMENNLQLTAMYLFLLVLYAVNVAGKLIAISPIHFFFD